ncbi:hypothetical protein EYF80_019247 [Liparis tanakae]|uniref:Uncharacterized protein n=1 Tax=Liparis tanakae TaxID=230148 RepID=A0A4Z2HZW4_9TELE|nr:hypothetical protein EYF80_019247 [Liparis tanakae]
MFNSTSQQEMLRGDSIYSSLKSEPIMPTDVTDGQESKHERRKAQHGHTAASLPPHCEQHLSAGLEGSANLGLSPGLNHI